MERAERWAYGALWAALGGGLALRAARGDVVLGRALAVPLALLAAVQSLCRACLPLPLGLALAAASACLLLRWAPGRRLLPVEGRAVLVTGERGAVPGCSGWCRGCAPGMRCSPGRRADGAGVAPLGGGLRFRGVSRCVRVPPSPGRVRRIAWVGRDPKGRLRSR